MEGRPSRVAGPASAGVSQSVLRLPGDGRPGGQGAGGISGGGRRAGGDPNAECGRVGDLRTWGPVGRSGRWHALGPRPPPRPSRLTTGSALRSSDRPPLKGRRLHPGCVVGSGPPHPPRWSAGGARAGGGRGAGTDRGACEGRPGVRMRGPRRRRRPNPPPAPSPSNPTRSPRVPCRPRPSTADRRTLPATEDSLGGGGPTRRLTPNFKSSPALPRLLHLSRPATPRKPPRAPAERAGPSRCRPQKLSTKGEKG